MGNSVCEYCGKNCSSKSNLAYHQKYTKYCIEGFQNTERTVFACKYCNKTLSTKYSLKNHMSKCPVKQKSDIKRWKKETLKEHSTEIAAWKKKCKALEKEINKLKDANEGLKDELFEQKGVVSGMQKGPGKTYNTTAYIHPKLINLPIANVPALTHEFIEQKVSDGILTYEKAAKGYSGMLEVICDLITHENDDGVIERSYVCTDVSRNSFHRLLESRKWKSDKGGRYLNSMLDRFRDQMEEYKDIVYETYNRTPHDSIEWDHVDWERKKISQLYSGVVCKEGTGDREELVNVLRKEIAKRASV